MTLAAFVLLLVTVQRLGELWISACNTRRLLAEGGKEYARGHYPLIVILHGAWLAGLWLFARERWVHPAWLTLFGLLQLARLWVLWSLGTRWTTRIIVLPGAPLVRRGPYRFLRHPNYLVVAGEIFVLPMALGMTAYAVLFGVLNAAVLAVRIRAEERALRAGAQRSVV